MGLKPIHHRWTFRDDNGAPVLEVEFVDIRGKIELVGEKAGRELRLYQPAENGAQSKMIIRSDVMDELIAMYFVARDPMETLKALVAKGR